MDLLGRFSRRAPGVRGGRGEFNWENLSNDKYRENYLGHSLMAPKSGGDDINWYTRDNNNKINSKKINQLDMVKQAERTALDLALGSSSVNYSGVAVANHHQHESRRRDSQHHHRRRRSSRSRSASLDRRRRHHHHHHHRRRQSPRRTRRE